MASKEPVNIEPRSTKNVIKTAQAAEYLGVAAQTLCKWRCVGGGPRFVKFGRAVGYRISDLDEWAAGRVCNSTSDPNYQTMPDPANDNESLDQTA